MKGKPNYRRGVFELISLFALMIVAFSLSGLRLSVAADSPVGGICTVSSSCGPKVNKSAAPVSAAKPNAVRSSEPPSSHGKGSFEVFRSRMQAHLDQIQNDISDLQKRINHNLNKSQKSLRDHLDHQVKDLNRQRQGIQKRLDNAGHAAAHGSSKAWIKFRTGIVQAWQQLQKSADKVRHQLTN